MKRAMMLLALIMMATPVFCAEEEDQDVLTDAPADAWKVMIGPVERIMLYSHDALQSRRDWLDGDQEEWRRGETTGSGVGIQAVAGKGTKAGNGFASAKFVRATYSWEFNPSPMNLHRIRTNRRDVEVSWSQYTVVDEKTKLGWDLGFKYIGASKSVIIEEGYYDIVTSSVRFNVVHTWLLMQGGYFGEWRPFGSDICTFTGRLNGLFGEVEGPARIGKDLGWDGQITEGYDDYDKFSLGYGMNANIGVEFAVLSRVNLSLAYEREWLTSFTATDTGVVMFPDNNDALFMEDSHSVYAALSILL